MSWREWAAQDAVGLAQLVRQRHVTPAELAQQAAAGIAATNPTLHGVIEVFDDVVQDPLKDGLNLDGPLGGAPFLMKDLGPQVFHQKWSAAQWTVQIQPILEGVLDNIVKHLDHAVERGIGGCDTRRGLLRQLRRRDVALTHQLCQADGILRCPLTPTHGHELA